MYLLSVLSVKSVVKKQTTMWNIFKRKKKKQMKELTQLSQAFAIITEFNRRGLIHWQTKDKILLIEESLAVVQMAQGEERFRNFLNHAANWQNFRLIRDAYDQARIDIEAKAVREAQQKDGRLSKADIQRIRQNARSKMDVIPVEQLPGLIREFDIMIIRANAISPQTAKEENGQLLALGHFDGKQVEMAMYEDIKHNLQNNE